MITGIRPKSPHRRTTRIPGPAPDPLGDLFRVSQTAVARFRKVGHQSCMPPDDGTGRIAPLSRSIRDHFDALAAVPEEQPVLK